MLHEAPRHDGSDLVVALLKLQAAYLFGDLAHRAVIVERLAGPGIAHEARILLDPDPLTGLIAIDFRDELGDAAVLEEKVMDLGSTRGIGIPFAGNVIDRGEHLFFRLESVQ